MGPIYTLIDQLKYFALHHKWPNPLLPSHLDGTKTIYEVYQSLTEEQKYLFNILIGCTVQDYEDEIQKIKKEHK